MDIETKNSEIKISETTAGCGSEVLAETDVIIPEDYPDIMRILQIDATAHIREKEVGNDRVILRGEANINIIYVPDPKMSDMPAKSITATAGFTDVCEARGISADMKLHSCADVSDIEYNLVNSRKINIKSTVSTEIKAMRQGETEFISDASSDMDLKTLKIPVSTFCQEADEDFIITVADKLEFPSGKPAAADILKVSANVFGSEVKLISGKAVVKGNVRVSTLYIGKKDPAIEYMEHEIPFTEILDLPGINENMDADIDYSVQSVYYEADYDESGRKIVRAVVYDRNRQPKGSIILAGTWTGSPSRANYPMDYLKDIGRFGNDAEVRMSTDYPMEMIVDGDVPTRYLLAPVVGLDGEELDGTEGSVGSMNRRRMGRGSRFRR